MSPHTPGPWVVTESKVPGYGRVIGISQENAKPTDKIGVATVDGGGSLNEDVLTEVRANACLIAAAPDLLAACRDAVVAMDGNMSRDTSQIPVQIVLAWNSLRYAIAKAEGK